MEQSNVEKLFKCMDEVTEIIQNAKNETYLESLIIALNTILGEEAQDELDDVTKHKVAKPMKTFNEEELDAESYRKALSLSILKGMKGASQQQHLMTPDTVGFLISYLVNKLIDKEGQISLFDPASGTANLLTTVLNQMQNPFKAYASEVDPTLIELAVLNANLQKKEISFYHQDSLRPFLIEPVDMVVTDLPVGYYPDDVTAEEYQLKAEEGHSYAHHLFIEQSLKYLKDGGFFIGVIPEFLFDSDQSDKLHAFLQEAAHIVGVIRLPETSFKSKNQAKSVLILQKKGNGTKEPKQPLLVQLPSFKNAQAMADIIKQVNQWFTSYPNRIK
ncbi:class I SAM-dependent methyltransferase [Oceanobacillus jeddahense]|uniref:Class I SAM-dependent methyltransferase n=1 Tax=Oceanobacillus jeddahense TaxID=1462527 RepID=A0ABY5JQI2_9BACI|nr:class I SAM-dependent methyltransferase [Oceanobacillus jeddahense]UUI01737.1 class I SAM-dependent methyltransferase [Oceanobacillus jeddahense]